MGDEASDSEPDPNTLEGRFGPKWRLYAAIGGGAIVAVVALVGYRIHVNLDTGGLGYVDAADLVAETPDTDDRKRAFFGALAPVVEVENQRILDLRDRLIAEREADGDRLAADVAEDFGMEWSGDNWSTLLARVDAVPLELALVQAAKESGWGRSRFAEDANNLFGQWCFSKGCGIVPKQRPEGATHEVQSFNSVNHAVRAYLMNINTHRAYRALRRVRAKARAAGKAPSALDLARTLTSYSERGEAYVQEVMKLIRANRGLMPTADG